jgi:hypothetical protein
MNLYNPITNTPLDKFFDIVVWVTKSLSQGGVKPEELVPAAKKLVYDLFKKKARNVEVSLRNDENNIPCLHGRFALSDPLIIQLEIPGIDHLIDFPVWKGAKMGDLMKLLARKVFFSAADAVEFWFRDALVDAREPVQSYENSTVKVVLKVNTLKIILDFSRNVPNDNRRKLYFIGVYPEEVVSGLLKRLGGMFGKCGSKLYLCQENGLAISGDSLAEGFSQETLILKRESDALFFSDGEKKRGEKKCKPGVPIFLSEVEDELRRKLRLEQDAKFTIGDREIGSDENLLRIGCHHGLPITGR